MPTADQSAALKDAAQARLELTAAEQLSMNSLSDIVTLRNAGMDPAPVEVRFRTNERQRLAAGEALTKARARVSLNGLGVEMLEARLPLALLPIRLETRYADGVLLVRIYPDDIHADGHEPPLTPLERTWWTEFRQQLDAATDRAPWVAAWRTLVGRAGLRRASYLAQLDPSPPPGSRPSSWSRAALGRLMPDRFVAYTWTTTSTNPIVTMAHNLVSEPLHLSADPSASGSTGETLLGSGAAWLHDFAAAKAAGLGLEITLDPPTGVVTRLIVFGARSSVTPDDAAREFGALLDAHHYTQGADLVAPGTATNALPGARPAYTSRPDPDQVYGDELEYVIHGATRTRRLPHYMTQVPPAQPHPDPAAASLRFAMALGIDPIALGYAPGGGDRWIAGESAMRSILRSAFEGGAALAFSPPAQASTISDAMNLIEHTSSLGPLPVLSLGPQPYGVLPVLVGARAGLDPFIVRALTALDALKTAVFDKAADQALRVSTSGHADPGEILLTLLRMDGVARELRVRPMLGADLAAHAVTWLDRPTQATIQRQIARAEQVLAAVGIQPPPTSALAKIISTREAGRIVRPLVATATATDHELPSVYLPWLVTLSIDDILAERYPAARPAGLLFDICRLAVLEAADADARTTLVADGHLNPAAFDEIHGALGTPRLRLAQRAPRPPAETLAQRLSNRTAGEAVRTSAVAGAIQALANETVPRLEMFLAATLGVWSHRLDAWYSSIAATQLEVLRFNPPAGSPAANGFWSGVNIGAFGWIEGIPRTPAGAGATYVHAPSVQHGAAAAVLLSADAAHSAAGHGSAFSVDLSSTRTRAALDLLEGVRNGQPLAALLGYGVERALADAGGTSPALIARLRAIAPLVANRLTTTTAETDRVAADTVVDGVALVRLATSDGAAAPNIAGLQTQLGTLDAAQTAALLVALQGAADALDAVNDLVLAEGVYQMVGGTMTRTAAATDGVSGAFVAPPDPDVVKTPQLGSAVTHRVAILLRSSNAPSGDWGNTPRAQAAPAVSAWIASVLPTPSRIRVRGSFGPATSFDVSLQDLLDRGRSASRDELAVAALDWVVMSERRAQGSLGAAEPSLRSLAELLRPAGSDATLVLDVARASGWSADALSVDDALQVGAAMRTLLSASRGLLPKDVSFGAVANDAEMTARSSAAQSAATQVLQQLADAGRTSATPQDKKSALLRAGQFGVSISAVDDELDAQLAAAARDLTNRVTAVNDPTLGPGDRLSVLFGRAFPAVPEVVLVTGSLDTALIQAPGATPAAVRTFLSRVGRVRDPVARLNAMLSFVDAVNPDDPGYSLRATQIPLSAGEQWVALPGPVSAGRKGLVAVTAGVLAGDMLTGIIVDEWIEIVPDGYANTSIAIHTNAPSVAAPNALILCVPTPGHEQWTADDLLAGVQDAITLTRLRAVDPDILGDAGQVLPALIARDDWYMRSLMVTLTEPGGAS